jgi:16S rRNA (guanine966-N2)-methyltransferase
MRIIAGEHRGRRIVPPAGKATRPMLDRVREALFSTLGESVEDARVLDLFSGTGSLGLEALSRGAREVRFVERDREAYDRLKRNVGGLEMTERAQLARANALDSDTWRARRDRTETAGAQGPWADIIFFDPPYAMIDDPGTRGRILSVVDELVRGVMAPDGVFVLHAPRRRVQRRELDASFDVDERTYGTTSLWYVRHGDDEPAGESGDDAEPEEGAAS